MIETIVDVALVIIAVALALWSVLVRATFVSIVGFVAFGLLLMIAWMRLGAPDVAMTEGAIGSGLAGMLLLGAAARLRRSAGSTPHAERDAPRRPAPVPAIPDAGPLQIACVAILALLVTGLIAGVVLRPVDPPPSLAPDAMAQLPRFGLGNAVNVVLLGYRALDTLVEKVVLVVALAGVWALTRAPAGTNGSRDARPRMQFDPVPEPLRFLARVLPPFGIVLAVYLVWHGANEPGGAFPAAALLASMALLVVIAGVAPAPSASRLSLRSVVVSGPVVFFLVGLMGIPLAGSFLAYAEGFEIPFIKLIELLLTASVAVILVMLILGPPEEERR